MLALSLSLREPITAATWSSIALLAVIYNGVIATLLGYIAYFTLVDAVGPVLVNLLTYVSPLVTALSGWLLFGEQLSILTVIGFLVITTGFILVEYQNITREATRIWAAFP